MVELKRWGKSNKNRKMRRKKEKRRGSEDGETEVGEQREQEK